MSQSSPKTITDTIHGWIHNEMYTVFTNDLIREFSLEPEVADRILSKYVADNDRTVRVTYLISGYTKEPGLEHDPTVKRLQFLHVDQKDLDKTRRKLHKPSKPTIHFVTSTAADDHYQRIPVPDLEDDVLTNTQSSNAHISTISLSSDPELNSSYSSQLDQNDNLSVTSSSTTTDSQPDSKRAKLILNSSQDDQSPKKTQKQKSITSFFTSKRTNNKTK